MPGDGVDHALRHLRAARVLEKDEIGVVLQRRELRAQLMNGEIGAVAHSILNPACFIKGSTVSQKNGNS